MSSFPSSSLQTPVSTSNSNCPLPFYTYNQSQSLHETKASDNHRPTPPQPPSYMPPQPPSSSSISSSSSSFQSPHSAKVNEKSSVNTSIQYNNAIHDDRMNNDGYTGERISSISPVNQPPPHPALLSSSIISSTSISPPRSPFLSSPLSPQTPTTKNTTSYSKLMSNKSLVMQKRQQMKSLSPNYNMFNSAQKNHNLVMLSRPTYASSTSNNNNQNLHSPQLAPTPPLLSNNIHSISNFSNASGSSTGMANNSNSLSGLCKRKDFLGIDEEAKSHPNRTYYFRKYQDTDKLIETCSQQLEGDEQNLQILYMRGSAYMKQNQDDSYRKAIDDFTSIIDITHGQDVTALYYRGVSLQKLGLINEAIVDFSKVMELTLNEHVNAAYARAACYNSKGNFLKAIDDYNLALVKDQEKLENGTGLPGSTNNDFGALTPNRANIHNNNSCNSYHTNQGESESHSHINSSLSKTDPSSLCKGKTNYLFTNKISAEENLKKKQSRSPCHLDNNISEGIAKININNNYMPRKSLKSSPNTTSSSNTREQTSSPVPMRFKSYSPRSRVFEEVEIFTINDKMTQKENEYRKKESLGGKEHGERIHENQINRLNKSNEVVQHLQNKRKEKDHQQESMKQYQQEQKQQIEKKYKLAEMHYNQGLALRKQGKFIAAIQEYGKAILQNPHHFKAHFNRAFAHDKRGDYEKAIDGYTDALNACDVVLTNESKQNIKNENKDQYDANTALYSKAYAHYNRGIAQDRLGRYHKAIEDFSTAIKILPYKADFYHNRGFCHRKKGSREGYEAAVKDYTSALEVDENHFKSLYNRANSYERLDLLEEAIADYTRALVLQPMNAGIWFNRANLYNRMKKHMDALKDYNHGIQLEINFATKTDASSTLSSLDDSKNKQEIEKVTKDLFCTSVAKGVNPVNLYTRAILLDRIGKNKEASRDFDLAIYIMKEKVNNLTKEKEKQDNEASSNNLKTLAVYYHDSGYCRRNLKEYKEAVQAYTAAISIDEKYISAYNNRGYAWRKLGELQKAIEDYTTSYELYSEKEELLRKKIKESSKDNVETNEIKEQELNVVQKDIIKVLNNRAYSFAKLGKYLLAIEDYSRVIDTDPTNSHAYHNRGISYDKIGKFKEAVEDFSRVLQLDEKIKTDSGNSHAVEEDQEGERIPKIKVYGENESEVEKDKNTEMEYSDIDVEESHREELFQKFQQQNLTSIPLSHGTSKTKHSFSRFSNVSSIQYSSTSPSFSDKGKSGSLLEGNSTRAKNSVSPITSFVSPGRPNRSIPLSISTLSSFNKTS